jgi:hypothetical protein
MACSQVSEMFPPYVTQDSLVHYTLEPIVTPHLPLTFN